MRWFFAAIVPVGVIPLLVLADRADAQTDPPGLGDLPDTVTWPAEIPARGETYMVSEFSHDIMATKRIEIEAIREQTRAIAAQTDALNRVAVAVETQNDKLDALTNAVGSISIVAEVAIPESVRVPLIETLDAVRLWLGPAPPAPPGPPEPPEPPAPDDSP